MTMVLWDKEANRRRISEELRKKRIFNTKQRQIGVDVLTLNHQVYENCLAREKELEKERQYAENSRRQDALALHMEYQHRHAIQQQCKDMDEFRLTVQRPENGRDFDLNDPHGKKKELPPRICFEDGYPVSGIQKLDGEDLSYQERLKKQKNQAHDFLLQQMQEKHMQRTVKADWDSRIIQQDNFALQLSRSESINRKEVSVSLSDFNRRLALQKQESNIQKKMLEETQNKNDIELNLYGDLLTENSSLVRNSSNPSRVLLDRWKGMDKDQLEEYYRGQQQQILENQRKKEQEHHKKTAWEEYLLDQQNMSRYLVKREKLHQQQILKRLQAENQQLAQEQRQQQEYFNKVVYSNVPTEDFFNQFNTSSR